jgi:diphthamide synthase (EF-2-diphthine--ammonia ligase)
MRVAVLATGGKDSILALYHVLQDGHEVRYLATLGFHWQKQKAPE